MRPKLFRDPVHDIISFDTQNRCDRTLTALLETPEVQRLRRIRQLGLANLVYPGAEHSRFTHSLGVTHVAGRILDQIGVPKRDEGIRIQTMAAALLHDIGHGPFSHAIEKVTQIDHEEVSIGLMMDPDTAVHSVLRSVDPTMPEAVAKMVSGEAPRSCYTDIISSQLDADRLDYILRDGLATGVKIGVYDLERILSTLDAGPDSLLVSHRAKEAVEGYLLARFHMFKQVYLHKAVRSAEKMLEAALSRASELLKMKKKALPVHTKALVRLLRSKNIAPSTFARLDDTDIWIALKEWSNAKDPILKELAGGLIHRRLYKTMVIPNGARSLVLETAREVVREQGGDPRYHLLVDMAADTAYKPYDPSVDSGQKPIILSRKNDFGRIEDHSDIVHLLGRDRFEIQRICFPERFRHRIQAALQFAGLNDS